jgi:hypothetical protein
MNAITHLLLAPCIGCLSYSMRGQDTGGHRWRKRGDPLRGAEARRWHVCCCGGRRAMVSAGSPRGQAVRQQLLPGLQRAPFHRRRERVNHETPAHRRHRHRAQQEAGHAKGKIVVTMGGDAGGA